MYLLQTTPAKIAVRPDSTFNDEEEEFSDCSDIDDCEEIDDDIETNQITISGKQMHIRTAVTKFCNGGRTIFGARSRQSRFFSGYFDKKVGHYNTSCAEHSGCTVISVKDMVEGYFFPKEGPNRSCMGEKHNTVYFCIC